MENGLYSNVSGRDFIQSFEGSPHWKNFSDEGLEALYYYFIELSEDINEPIEFNLGGIALDYTEYTYDDFINGHADIIDENLSVEEQKEQVKDYLHNKTTFIEIDNNSFIAGEF